MSDNAKTVFILADGTGETAEKVATAALTQFPRINARTLAFTRVRSKLEISEIMDHAAREHAFVVYTVIDPEHREYIQQCALQLKVEVADLIGGLVGRLTSFLGAEPLMAPGVQYQLDAQYFRRVEAVEFAVKSDDGRSPQNFYGADLVFVGPSRTSKTALSMLLAHKGYRVANLPLTPEISPPPALFEIDQEKIFGLIVDLNSLTEVRHARLEQLGLPTDADYASRESIAGELRWCRNFYAQHPTWPVVNISGRSVEQMAAEVIRINQERATRRSTDRPTKA